MTDKNSSSALSIYRRILGYARPYKVRLIIGILAGIVAGGSLFGLLQGVPGVLSLLDSPVVIEEPVPESASTRYEGLDDNFVKAIKVAEERGLPVMKEDGSLTWQVMLLALLALPMFVILRGAGIFANRYFMRWVGAAIVRDLRDQLFNNLQNQSLKFFGNSDVGQLISRCTNDTNVVEQVISTTIADIVRAPIEIIAAVLFAVSFSSENNLLQVVGGIGLFFPLCIVPIVILGKYVRRYTKHALTRISDLVSRMHENLTGITAVKAFHMEDEEFSRFKRMDAKYFRTIIRALRAELLMSPLVEAVAMLLVLAFAIVCIMKGVKLSQILPVAMAAVVIYKPIKQLARINTGLQKGAAALARIFELIDMNEVVVEADEPQVVESFKENIVFENVDFKYQEDGNSILSDINVTVPTGTVLALVGETGSGKSTMANLLARFYDPIAGKVLLDGIDLKELEIASLRRLVGVVSQHTILFNDTVAYNISYGTKGATQEQIEAAAKMANAHEFIIADPDGYNRVVGEKGFVLSGGERQRIAIARAILKNPPILILDEATSALDTVTERLVQDAINKVMEGRTVFAIAHRLSTVKHADQILLLDSGKVVERGTHDELIAKGKRYKKLCDMQMLNRE